VEVRSGIDAVLCPRCAAPLNVRAREIVCAPCSRQFPRAAGIPVIMHDPNSYLLSARRQLSNLEQQASLTLHVIEELRQRSDLIPETRNRCQAMMDAVRNQTSGIRRVLQPIVGTIVEDAGDASVECPAPLQYINYLYRDWGWPAEVDGENERALAAVSAVAGKEPLGCTLVLGAGACRLAYDLHRCYPETDTTVVDIDLFVFAMAHAVIRGESLKLSEANAEIDELGHVAREWTLTAPKGAIDDDHFHFMLADGLNAPFRDKTFDTVVTPWFIDQIPSDLRNCLSEVHRLLKPGGHWLNHGPLRYRPETPLELRFGREELFDLASRAGFQIDQWKTESVPYLVSKLNGRGKMESVLSFSATKSELHNAQAETRAWLLFRHVPVPVFPGLPRFRTEDPAEQIVAAAIDGVRTLDDIALILATNAGDAGLTMDQFREIVRRCLAEIAQRCGMEF